MHKLLIATRNAHKVAEIQTLLGEGFECLTLAAYPDVPDAIENGETFGDNAAIKANTVAEWLRDKDLDHQVDFVLADDSGLEVDALDGAPGIHSARFAQEDEEAGNSSDADNNAKLLSLLADKSGEEKSARFRCVLALVSMTEADQGPAYFEGASEGRIQDAAAGGAGFGYDPLFIPAGHDQSYAELGEELKNQISHRSGALKQLRAHFERG
ncbi:MAG: RdgB/HAM1 family non-canonical purine NTP pyrophosphatase [Verrucomicrobiia bacterium]|jgi:XTP/dITP diphosphohydrolase